jgi:arginine deiminase
VQLAAVPQQHAQSWMDFVVPHLALPMREVWTFDQKAVRQSLTSASKGVMDLQSLALEELSTCQGGDICMSVPLP